MISFNNFHRISAIHNKIFAWLSHTTNLNKIKGINPVRFQYTMERGEHIDNTKHSQMGSAGIIDENIINIDIDPMEFVYKENNPLYKTNDNLLICLIQTFHILFLISCN